MVVSRRKALMLSAASGLVAATAHPGTASAAPPLAGYVPAPDLGVSPANSAATNRANLVAALSGSAVCVLFPPGDYRIDNSGQNIVISDYAGELVMQPGARLVFTDNTWWTLPIGVQQFQGQYSAEYARVFAYLVLAMVPALAFYSVAERQLVGGLTAGATKG